MPFHIRPSELSDTEALGKLHSRVWHESYADIIPADTLLTVASAQHRTAIRHEMFATSTGTCAHFLVEDEEREVVGFCDCGPADEVKGFAESEIYTLYLLNRAQGQGLGKAMMLKMFQHLAHKGFEQTALRVFAKNETTLQFYRHLGGAQVDQAQIDFLGTVLPLLVFAWKDLHESMERMEGL